MAVERSAPVFMRPLLGRLMAVWRARMSGALNVLNGSTFSLEDVVKIATFSTSID